MSKREEYISEEIKEWEKIYDIPFPYKFNLKYLLGTQFDLINTPSDHTKTRMDLAKIYQDFQKNLDRNITLKRRMASKGRKTDIVFLLKDGYQVKNVSLIFKTMMDYSDNINHIGIYSNRAIIETDDVKIRFLVKTGDSMRGIKADYFYDLTDVTRNYLP